MVVNAQRKAKFVRGVKLTGILIAGGVVFIILMGVLSALQPLIFGLLMGVGV